MDQHPVRDLEVNTIFLSYSLFGPSNRLMICKASNHKIAQTMSLYS